MTHINRKRFSVGPPIKLEDYFIRNVRMKESKKAFSSPIGLFFLFSHSFIDLQFATTYSNYVVVHDNNYICVYDSTNRSIENDDKRKESRKDFVKKQFRLLLFTETAAAAAAS